MYRYKVKVTDRITKAVLFDGEQLASTEKQVHTMYRIKYPFAVIKACKMKKKPGTQLDLETAIKEVENENK